MRQFYLAYRDRGERIVRPGVGQVPKIDCEGILSA